MRNRIKAALKEAVDGDDPTRTATLRLIDAALKDREHDLLSNSDEEGGKFPDQHVFELLSKMIAQREESARAYEEAGRLELAQREVDEIAVIREFLPKPLSEQEVMQAVDAAVAELGAKDLREMGSVIALLKARYPNRMDFSALGPLLRKRLTA
ncbi:MAG: GatB/YqeY domain-containing protein [Neomegalonema sp.]|nr:GatB/YqeY domain-containing protein [Neomegalonema sp.]